jgi:hypothetical protein
MPASTSTSVSAVPSNPALEKVRSARKLLKKKSVDAALKVLDDLEVLLQQPNPINEAFLRLEQKLDAISKQQSSATAAAKSAASAAKKASEGPSYAAIAAKRQVPPPLLPDPSSQRNRSKRLPEQRTSCRVVAVAPGQTAEAAKEAILRTVKPSQIGVGFRQFRTIAADKLLIEVDSPASKDKLCQSAAESLNTLGITLENERRRKPSVRISNIHKDVKPEDLASTLRRQNGLEAKDHIALRTTLRQRNDQLYTAVFAVDGKVRNKFLTSGKVYIEHQSCPVRDHIHVMQCFKCLGFGHTASKCEDHIRCRHCAGKHKSAECPKSADPTTTRCINCKREKLDDKSHHPDTDKCPIFRRHYNRCVMKCDYSHDEQ